MHVLRRPPTGGRLQNINVPLPAGNESRLKPARHKSLPLQGRSRLFRPKPAPFLAERSRLSWPKKPASSGGRLEPASSGSFRGAQRKEGAGVSRRKPALFRPKKPAFGRKKPALAKGSRLWPKEPLNTLGAGVSRRKPAFPCFPVEAGVSRRKPAFAVSAIRKPA